MSVPTRILLLGGFAVTAGTHQHEWAVVAVGTVLVVYGALTFARRRS